MNDEFRIKCLEKLIVDKEMEDINMNNEFRIKYLEKLIVEIVTSLRPVEISKEHKHFINTNYKEILKILHEWLEEES